MSTATVAIGNEGNSMIILCRSNYKPSFASRVREGNYLVRGHTACRDNESWWGEDPKKNKVEYRNPQHINPPPPRRAETDPHRSSGHLFPGAHS